MTTSPARQICGLYGIADSSAYQDGPVQLAKLLLTSGCRIIQLRCKGWKEQDIVTAAVQLRSACDAAGALLILNDHAHLVKAVGADGVHLGQEDLSTEEARAHLDSEHLLGRSTHSLDQALRASKEADYIAIGPIFETEHLSTPKPVVGLHTITQVRAHLPNTIPLVVIGGITASHLPQLKAAGADAWAVIGAIAKAPDPVFAAQQFMAD